MSNLNCLYLLKSFGNEQLSIPRLHWNLEISIFWPISIFKVIFFSKILTWVFSSRSQPEIVYFCWNVQLGVIFFHPCTGIPKQRNSQKVLLGWTFFVIVSQIRIFEPYLLHFSKRQLMAVYLRRTFHFWKSNNVSFTSEMESWLIRIKKVLLVLRYIEFQTCTSRRLHFWNCYQVLNWRFFLIFQMFIRWNNQCFFPLHWNIEMLNMRNCPMKIFILFVFRPIIIWSHRLEFFRRCLYRHVSCQYWVLFICDLLYVRSIFLCATLTENIAGQLSFLLE